MTISVKCTKKAFCWLFTTVSVFWSVLHQELPEGVNEPARFFIQGSCIFNNCILINYA